MAKQGVKRAEEATSIVIQDITIGQVTRGNQTIQTWFQNIKSAESSLNPNRRQLLNTYFDVSIDLHLRSVMDKRIRAVKTTPFEWVGLENEVIMENFKAPWFAEFLHRLQERIFWGTTLVEFMLGSDGLIGDVQLVPRQNVKPERGLISKDGVSDAGIFYREGVYVNYILEIGRKNDLGLLANIAPYVLMKRQNLADFTRYNEMFGMPLRVYEYDPNKPQGREEAKRSAEDFGSAAYIIVPKGFADVRFEDSVKQSTAYAYDKLHEILNNEITIGVLGQLLTTGGEGGGSYELGKVHKAVEEAINLEDRLYAEYVINYPMKHNILVPHGYPLEGIRGKFKTADELNKEKKLAIWIQLLQSGAPIAEEDFYKEFGIEPPGQRPVVVRTGNSGNNTAPPETDPPKPQPPAKPQGGSPAKGSPQGGAGAKKLADLRAYYKLGSAANKRGTGAITLSYRNDLNEIIDDIIARVRNGSLRPGDVDPALSKLVSEQLFKGVEKGYNLTLAAARGSDKLMLETLRQNVYRFSGFKNYHFVLDANALLRNAEGNVKAFSEFRADVLALNKEYNVDFLRTEYNHAVATSRMAGKWKRFKDDVAELPLLQFETVGDERTRAAHQKFDGIIKPVTDPFWNKWLPPLDYNCRCTVRQLSDGEVSTLNVNDLGDPKPGFGINWGEQQVVFPRTHPQFEVEPEHEQQADNNFNLPLAP